MKHALTMAALVLAGCPLQSAFAQSNPADLVKQAVAAEGGADALRALKSLAIKGDAKFWEPGQSFAAGGEPRFLGDATFAITWDLAKGVARTDWDRDQKYPEPIKLKYTETLFPTFGVVTDPKSSQPMSRNRVAALLRELKRASPRLLIDALDDPSNVRAAEPQPLGQQSLPAVMFSDQGTSFTILFDRETHLPAAIRSRDDDNIHGDSNYDLVLGGWKAVGGAKLAQTLSYRINGVEVAKLDYREVAANTAIAADAFAVPDAVKAVARSAGDRQRAVSMGAAPAVPDPLSRKRQRDLSDRRRPQAGRARPQCAACRGRHRQQPDRRDEGLPGDLRRPLWRAAIALDHRCREGQISRQADQISGPHPPSHGPYRRHAHLRGGGRDHHRPEPGQGLFRAGRRARRARWCRTICRKSRRPRISSRSRT